MAHEAAFRLAVFAGALGLLSLAEAMWPLRRRSLARAGRWTANAALSLSGALAIRLAAPVAVAGAALWASASGFGLFNWTGLPVWIEGLAALVALDVALYAQHRAFHAVPLLWRLHAVHHTDEDLDATSAVRFHPLEQLVSLAWKAGVVVALGAPPVAVVLYEALLNAAAIFHHANLRLPPKVADRLARVVVTPHLHAIHHSDRRVETDSNFGVVTPLWDRLFGTFCAAPAPGFRLGLAPHDAAASTSVARLLAQPFATGRPRERVA